jgi:hypothetical protein
VAAARGSADGSMSIAMMLLGLCGWWCRQLSATGPGSDAPPHFALSAESILQGLAGAPPPLEEW